MAWAVDKTGVVLLLACQLLTGLAAAIVLAFTAQAMTHLFATGPVPERRHAALPALIVLTTAAGIGRVGSALSSYADGRITPLLMTEADIALVATVCRVESSAYGEDGFADRQEAAEVGVTRTRMMVQDAQRFMSALIRMIAASGVITVLHPLMLPLLLLAVLPAGAGVPPLERGQSKKQGDAVDSPGCSRLRDPETEDHCRTCQVRPSARCHQQDAVIQRQSPRLAAGRLPSLRRRTSTTCSRICRSFGPAIRPTHLG
ncbi:hypothetical protein [Streptomyces sp. NPDC058086]|uniref:hypothetical protein n=1 Tax=Streptomyces sp. NPDC058086 TaxID=3346334 RepID=UPI0036E49F94